MPNFIGGIPLGPPNYVDSIPTPSPQTVSDAPDDSFGPLPPINGFDYPAQATGVGIVGAGMVVVYSIDRGLRGAPVAGPFASQCAVWRVHGGMVYKTVTAVLQAVGGPPTLPSPVVNDNEVLLTAVPTIPSNQVMGDGTPVYVRAIQYVFLLQQPPADLDPLYGCVVQLDTTPISQNVIYPSDYVPNLLGPTPPPAAFTGGPITF